MEKDTIVRGFDLLGIHPEDYPEYSDPNSFAERFKICSAYTENDVSSSGKAVEVKRTAE